MAENRLPPMEEARVRTAALVAAQRMSWDVPRHVLDYIVATSDPRQSPAALEARAAGIVEYVRNHPDRPDFANATEGEARGFFQMIHGQVVSRFGGLPWALAMAREEEASDRSGGSAAYAELGGDLGSITPSNFTRSHYHQCGVDYATFDALRREGFSGQNIINAASDARALGFRANDREAMRDHALIDRHSIDARGMNTALQDYQRRTREDTELNDLIRRRQQATTAEQQQALDVLIAARRLEHQRASGLHGHLTNPAERPQAVESGRRRRDAVDRELEEGLTLTPDRAPDHAISVEDSRRRLDASGQALQLREEINRVVDRDRARPPSAAIADVNNVFGEATVSVTAVVPPPPLTPPPAVIQRTDAPPPAPEQPPPQVVAQAPPPPSSTLAR